MSDFLQEIDDALRREKAEKFWKDNGPYIIGGAVLLVLFTAGFTLYNNWQGKRYAAQTATLVTAMQTPTPGQALTQAAGALRGQHKVMALLQAGGFMARDGNAAKALPLFQQAAAAKAPALWHDLAVMAAVRAEMDQKNMPKAQAQELLAKLKPLLAAENPWHLQAALQAAVLAGDALDDPQAALAFLRAPLAAQDAPPTIRERALTLDHLYTLLSSARRPTKEKTQDKS